MHIETRNLRLVAQTRAEVREWIVQLPPHEKIELSAGWLAMVEGSSAADPWIHGFALVHRASNDLVGKCGFKGPPGADGAVEIAYGVTPEHQGKGYATETAAALTDYAFNSGEVCVVLAHTLPGPNASTRVLTKCGFQRVGEVVDPEDGLVWRWEKRKGTA